MVEDVVKVEAFDAHAQSVVRHVVHWRGVNVPRQPQSTYAIVVARFTIEQVYAYLRAVKTDVKLLLSFVCAKVVKVECITQEHPSPSKIRS